MHYADSPCAADGAYDMWTLILVTLIINGSVTGGVSSTTTFLDFANEERCRTAAGTMQATEHLAINDRAGHTNISPPAYYRTIARCVER
jgi:hypothetical protein